MKKQEINSANAFNQVCHKCPNMIKQKIYVDSLTRKERALCKMGKYGEPLTLGFVMSMKHRPEVWRFNPLDEQFTPPKKCPFQLELTLVEQK